MPRILPAARRLLALTLVAFVSLAGCGLKGDLFLPDEPPATATRSSDADAASPIDDPAESGDAS